VTTTEATLIRLKRERDSAKQQFDEMSGRREHLLMQQQRLIREADSAQVAFQTAVGRGDIDGMQSAKARLAEIHQKRDEFTDMISALGNHVGVLRSHYGEAHDRLRHEESEAEYLARRIARLRRELANAQQRASAYGVFNDNTSPESLSAELHVCEEKYRVLAGEVLPPIAA
jgi:chromosome segregation ATPase